MSRATRGERWEVKYCGQEQPREDTRKIEEGKALGDKGLLWQSQDFPKVLYHHEAQRTPADTAATHATKTPTCIVSPSSQKKHNDNANFVYFGEILENL